MAQLLQKTLEAEAASVDVATREHGFDGMRLIIQKLQNKFDKVEEELNEKAEEIEALETKVSEVEEDRDEKVEEIESLEAQVAELQEERDSMEEERDEKVEEIEALEAQNADMEYEKEALEEQVNELQAHIDEVDENDGPLPWDSDARQNNSWHKKLLKDTYMIMRTPAIGSKMTWSNGGVVKDTTVVGDVDDMECTICRDEYRKDDMLGKLPCGHYHHQECIYTWMDGRSERLKCPRCTKGFSLRLALPEGGKGQVNVAYGSDMDMSGV